MAQQGAVDAIHQRRRVLAHRVSITMEADFCVEALAEAVARYGPPQIMNTDQGSQFTSAEWIGTLERAGARDIIRTVRGEGYLFAAKVERKG